MTVIHMYMAAREVGGRRVGWVRKDGAKREALARGRAPEEAGRAKRREVWKDSCGRFLSCGKGKGWVEQGCSCNSSAVFVDFCVEFWSKRGGEMRWSVREGACVSCAGLCALMQRYR